jgi:MYXO-CTERM domain-containing protein
MRRIKIALLSLTLVCSMPALLQAQAPDTRSTAPSENRNDDKDWGWIGLLGLAGLFGLARRDRRDVVDDRIAARTTR